MQETELFECWCGFKTVSSDEMEDHAEAGCEVA